jgi:hypothetical protein
MHVIRTTLLAAMFCVTGCSGTTTPPPEPFATMQLCFDSHHTVEMLSVNDSIVVCCLDHPINGVHPSCGATVAACNSRLTGTDPVGMLTLTTEVTTAAIAMACQDYITKKGM